MARMPEKGGIIGLAFGLVESAHRFAEHARLFFYQIVLLERDCPQCQGKLVMRRDGEAQCTHCGQPLDPTLSFQHCPECGGALALRICRYQCRQCGADVPSRFLFDGRVYDAEYFRVRMAESRQRQRDLRQRVREMLAASRSADLIPSPADLAAVPGLIEDLDAMIGDAESVLAFWPKDGFDLTRYETHLQAHIGASEVAFDELPPLGEDRRQDRIWRFIAILFLAQAGAIELWQQGQTIMVMKRETDREGQGISGETEAAV